MIDFSLKSEETALLKDLIGKKLVKIKHDPLNKFDKETVYGRVELYFDDSIILVDYDYRPYPLFESQDNDRPMFSIKAIGEKEACSALQNTFQIYVNCGKTIKGITLVEDHTKAEWRGRRDEAKALIAIVFRFDQDEMAIQGDYMMPLLDILKGENARDMLSEPGEEFDDDPSTKSETHRFYVEL